MPGLSQSFTVAFPRAEVWRVFRDVDRIVGCMPGASLDEPPDGNQLHGQIRVKLGPIAAAFAGEAEILMDDAQWSGVIRGQGLDRKNNSRARAELGFRLVEQAPGTRVDVTVDYTLAGPLAQFGRGAIVQGIAERLTEEFARNLAAEMERRPARAAPPELGPADRPQPGGTREIMLSGLLWSLLITWLKRSLAWWRR